jgi:hypothetical protein
MQGEALVALTAEPVLIMVALAGAAIPLLMDLEVQAKQILAGVAQHREEPLALTLVAPAALA